MNPLPLPYPFSRNSNRQTNLKAASLSSDSVEAHAWLAPHSLWGVNWHAALLALVTAVALHAGPAQGANLLVNPSFEANNGQVVPTGWTYFAPPTTTVQDYWVVATNTVGCSHMLPHSGTYYWKEWGALYNAAVSNVAGIYQTLGSSPGAIYQVSGWLATSSCDQLRPDCYTWLQVEFLDVNTNVLALYKSSEFSASAGADTWLQYQVTNACDLTQPVATGDPYFTTYAVTGSVSQLVAPSGTTQIRYRYCYFQAGSEGGSAFLDDAVLNQVSGPVPPVISNLFPQDMIFVNPSNGLSFNVTSPSGFTINNSGIHLTLNGTNVSGSLAISGSASSKNVTYSGLQSNSTYTVAISVTDVSNLTVNASTYFETTWVGIPPVTYLWEAEDWDFNSGMYIDNPDLCNASGDPNCYFGKVGVAGVDENNTSGSSGPYRPGDPMGTGPSGDYLRKNLFEADRVDYCINPFNGGEWVNYTRDWPNSTNLVVARLATDIGLSGSVTLSVVNPDTTTTELGTFKITDGLGWTTFENVLLKDTNGNNAVVILNGKQTLQVTSGGNLLPNFFALVAAQADLPLLSNVYPTGTHPFEYTNTFSFTVTTFGSSFPANGIRVNFDGYDVTSNLAITGSASTKNVVLPSILPNAIHVAITTVTNVLGHGIAVTNNFDTFSEANYMVELEDFDYGGGQFIPNALPDSYFGYGATTNIDYQHTMLDGESFPYRTEGIPEDLLGQHDWLRSNFVYWGGIDYVLTYFAANDWANYTRVYPTGNFYAYIRSSGDGPYSLYLDEVVSGTGTTSQVTKQLGQFGGFGRSPVYITYDWVPLTDNGLAAPAVVTLNGQATLRVSTGGDCNPNFVMLVPTSGINLKAASSGNNTVLSFPSQAGVNYRVFYRTNLTAGNWTILTNVLGSGAIRSVSDSHTGTSRFYKVTAP
jgi:hypothetical protein